MIVWTRVDAAGTSTVECPYCGQRKRIRIPRIDSRESDVKIKTKCTCGKSFFLAFDKRRHSRKNTNLTGGYLHLRREYRGLVTIKSVSKSGVGIELNSERAMLKNDKVLLRFNLDDERKSYIEKQAKIKRSEGLKFGLEFMEPLAEHDPLQRYLT